MGGRSLLEAEEALVAELLEELSQASGFREACSITLASILARRPLERVAILVLGEDGAQEVTPSLPGLRPRVSPEDLHGPALERAMRSGDPVELSADGATDIRCAVIPFGDGAGGPLGALLVETADPGAETRLLQAVLRRSERALGRIRARERLVNRLETLEQENALLRRIHDDFADPVILTDPDNNILLANQRARALFSARSGDSLGRSRAVGTNAFLFSTFLTQEQIGEGRAGPRELNLVEPSDGSDLFFEVLTTPLSAADGETPLLLSVLRDLTDLQRVVNELELAYRRSRGAEHRARQESQRLNAIIENAGEPILVTDGQSKIVLMNAGAELLFEFPPQAGQPRRQHDIWANVTRFTSLVHEFLLRPESRLEERLALTDPAKGRELPVLAVSTKILDRLDEPVAVVTVLRDLTQEMENERLAGELRDLNDELEARIAVATRELEERNRLLEWQSQELQKASRLKSEFLARMSHELRTPINAMLGYTTLLQERIYGDLNAEQQNALERIDVASEHLLALISDILDLSKIEAGRMPVRLETVRLEGIVSSISETIRPLVDEKGLEFDVELDEDLPALKTDPTKLKQVLLNLLENAVKYTDRGSVALRGRPADGRLHLEVEDTGIGIEPDHLELIFEDFRQVDDVPNRAYGGAGLGLSISRKLLAFLGGWISVESEVGRGTRFSVELPLRADPDSLDRTARRMMLDVADPEPGEPDETKEPSAGEARPASAVEPDVERRPAGPDAARDGDPR